MFYNNKKSRFQVALIEAIISLVIFAAVLFSIFVILESTINQEKNILDERKKILALTSFLVETPGKPFLWHKKNLSDVNYFGLAFEKNIVSNYLTTKLKFYDENLLLKKLSEDFAINGDIYIEIKDFSGNILFSLGDKTNKETVVQRVILYNNQEAFLRVYADIEK